VEEVRFAVVVARLQRVGAARRLRADGHHLERDDVARAARLGLAHVVGQTQVLAAELAREGEARDLARPIGGVVYDHVVAAAGRRKIAVYDARVEKRHSLS